VQKEIGAKLKNKVRGPRRHRWAPWVRRRGAAAADAPPLPRNARRAPCVYPPTHTLASPAGSPLPPPHAHPRAQEPADAEKARKAELEKAIPDAEAAVAALLAARDKALSEVPNELDPTVPVSNNEDDNGLVRTWGTLRSTGPELLHHHEILTMIDGYEPERGVAVAGAFDTRSEVWGGGGGGRAAAAAAAAARAARRRWFR
jgi:hypothetical protein